VSSFYGADHLETNGTSFTFLGFTHVWGKSRLGKNVVRQVTAKNRYARALAAVTAWCRVNRHQSIRDQHAHLTAMMRGHYAYYGITGVLRRLCKRGTATETGTSRNARWTQAIQTAKSPRTEGWLSGLRQRTQCAYGEPYREVRILPPSATLAASKPSQILPLLS
jgi:hypothetical protein